ALGAVVGLSVCGLCRFRFRSSFGLRFNETRTRAARVSLGNFSPRFSATGDCRARWSPRKDKWLLY
ncbi:unnamed protein product, partial [Amoebophrya sp. A25]